MEELCYRREWFSDESTVIFEFLLKIGISEKLRKQMFVPPTKFWLYHWSINVVQTIKLKMWITPKRQQRNQPINSSINLSIKSFCPKTLIGGKGDLLSIWRIYLKRKRWNKQTNYQSQKCLEAYSSTRQTIFWKRDQNDSINWAKNCCKKMSVLVKYWPGKKVIKQAESIIL